MKHIDVDERMRANGIGYKMLYSIVADDLIHRNYQFIVLEHYDKSGQSGGLVQWYQRAGFFYCTSVLPNDIIDYISHDCMIAESSTIVEKLRELV